MNWIKMRTHLHDCPDVHQIAAETGLDVYAVIGRLHRMWSWFDEWTEDGRMSQTNVTHVTLDKLVCHTGFAQAVTNAGWLSVDDGVMILPNFDRHNGETAKKRARAAERQRACRAEKPRKTKPRKVTDPHVDPVTKTCDQNRIEKKREDVPLSVAVAPESEHPLSIFESDRSELPLNFEPCTDEWDAALRFDPWEALEKQTRTRKQAVIEMAGMVNSGAEKFTPESLAEAYIAEAARRDLRVFNPRRQESAAKLTSGNLRADLVAFIRIAKGDPERNNLVLQAGSAPHHGPIPEPDFDWRTAMGIIKGNGVSIEQSRTWDTLPKPMQRNLVENGPPALKSQKIAS